MVFCGGGKKYGMSLEFGERKCFWSTRQIIWLLWLFFFPTWVGNGSLHGSKTLMQYINYRQTENAKDGKKWVNLVPWRQVVHLARGWKIDLSGATEVTQRLSFYNKPVVFIIGSFSFWAISLVKVAYPWFGKENWLCFWKAMSHFWPYSPHLLMLSLLLMQWGYEFIAGGASWY